MSSRIRKYRKKSFETTAFRRYSLLYILSSFHSLIILSCYNYAIRNISLYRVSESDSGYCEVCILTNCIGCDVLEVTEKQLMNFAVQYIRLKDEMQRTTERLLQL